MRLIDTDELIQCVVKPLALAVGVSGLPKMRITV